MADQQIIEGMEIDESRFTLREDPRIREQDWGNYQKADEIRQARNDRRNFGSFYYRLPNGESGSDVYDRVTSFWSTLQREMRYPHALENFVIVTHGITLRMILMRYFKWTVDQYHCIWNPPNGKVIVLELDERGKYQLRKPLPNNYDAAV